MRYLLLFFDLAAMVLAVGIGAGHAFVAHLSRAGHAFVVPCLRLAWREDLSRVDSWKNSHFLLLGNDFFDEKS